MARGKVISIESKAKWDEELKKAQEKGLKVVVDFTATWCGPCRMIGPYFEELSTSLDGKIIFLKVDVDAVDEVAQTAGVTAMPTFQVYDGETKVDELVGASKDKLKAMCESHAK